MAEPILFAYAPSTGEFFGPTQADPDPEREGGWLWPGFSTDVPPPAASTGLAAVFDQGAWALVPNRRGETWYGPDGGSVIVDRLGDPTTFDPALVPGPLPAPPDDLVAYAKQARDAHELGGILIRGIPIATDDRSKTLVMGALRRVEKDPSIVTSWSALDGHIYPLDAAAIIAISDALGDHVAESFEAYSRVRAGLADGSITDKAGVDAVFAAVDVAY